jgi:hypothetical protein
MSNISSLLSQGFRGYMAFMRRILQIALILLPFPAIAQEAAPQFILPAACTLGTDCWTVNYADTAPTVDEASDFTCGAKTYDDHKGTDFGLRSRAEMETGVDVLAAASGTVQRLREGESDAVKTAEELEAVRKQQKECGNAVLLDHGNGLQTLYCHLKKGSLAVKISQHVSAGEKIAQIGQSGLAEFPHLHFGVVRDGAVIDPYTGANITEGCGQPPEPLWAYGLPMGYEPVALYDAGFRPAAPDFAAIENGEAQPAFTSSSPALVFWAAIYGAAKDDIIDLEIIAPDGSELAKRSIVQEKNRARQYYYSGRNAAQGLMPGTYTATAKLRRGGNITRTLQRTIEIK